MTVSEREERFETMLLDNSCLNRQSRTRLPCLCLDRRCKVAFKYYSRSMHRLQDVTSMLCSAGSLWWQVLTPLDISKLCWGAFIRMARSVGTLQHDHTYPGLARATLQGRQ